MNANLLESPAVERSWNPKLACAISLVLVFLCGGALGAVVMDLGVHNRQRVPTFETAAGKAHYFQELKKELDLTPAQSEQLESILNDFWHYYRSVLNNGKVQVEQVLTEQQRLKFERMLQDPQKRWQ